MKAIRVRFAPSPTGALHIGGVRTALYNYLFARKNKGTFILRIEDTDQTRYVEGAEQYIVDALKWLGLEFDESPEKGGAKGPYRQSERKETGLYLQMAETLVHNGHAYYAYDTEEELSLQRIKYEQEGKKFKYDAHSRMTLKNSLALDEASCLQLEKEGAPKVIRLLVPENGEVIFQDQVRGTVRFDCSELDDKVMLKSDGMPTYHLANVVDDHDMEISHVIRGEEWLPSTPTHVLLYQFFGWQDEMPEFAHLPLILKPEPSAYINKKSRAHFTNLFANSFLIKHPGFEENKVLAQIDQLLQDPKNISNRLKINEGKDSKLQVELKTFLKSILFGKLSKRDGDRLGMPVFPMDWIGEDPADHFKGFREWGFLPEAVLNILALLGWNDGSDQEMFTLEEMILNFEMGRVSSSGARFNFEKAKWFNKQYIISSDNNSLIAQLDKKAQDALKDKNTIEAESILNLIKLRMNFLNEFYDKAFYFFESLDLKTLKAGDVQYDKKVTQVWSEEVCNKLTEIIQLISGISNFDSEKIASVVEPLIDASKGLYLPILRLAISGETTGPDLYKIMFILGKQCTIQRLNALLDTQKK